MNRAITRPEAGFGLIEVLVTVLVISAGLLAYVALQRDVFREANLASAQVAATELALGKLDDLRGYTHLNATAGTFAYQDIDNDTGGALAAGAVAVNSVSLTRNWTVTDYWYTGANMAPTTTAPTGNPLPSFKLVTVTITWTDLNGDAQSLAISGTIAASNPQLIATIFQ